MTTTYRGASWVAWKLGVTPGQITSWCTQDNDFPAPDIAITGPREGKTTGRGWAHDRLPELRAWLAQRRHLTDTEAAHHWAQLDDPDSSASWHRRSQRMGGQLVLGMEP